MSDWRDYVRGHLPPLHVGPERENEIVDELALQMEQAYADAVSSGASPGEARSKAEHQFRNWEALALEIDTAERGRMPRLFAGMQQDARYAVRQLVRNPGFAAVAVLTLAFGIGVNVAVFSMADALVLRSLPYRDSGRLMAIETRRPQQPEIEPWTSPPDFFDMREHSRAFSSIAAIDPIWNLVLTGRGEAEQVQTLFTSANLFPMLGVNAVAGRLYSVDEDIATKPAAVVVLSYSFWQRRFGGRHDILGQGLTLDNSVFTVIGVLPREFRYAGEPLAGTATEIDVYIPLAANPLTMAGRALRCLKVVGALRPEISPEQANDEMRRIGIALAEQYPASNRGYAVSVQPLRSQVTSRVRLTMLLMLGAVGFVLLMACANVAGLLLARAAARSREISVRLAVGASQFRLLRQLLTEGLVLALAGGCAGLVLARFSLQLLSAAAPSTLLQGRTLSLDTRALLFTSLVVLTCAVLSALPPAWRILRGDAAPALREAGRGLTSGHHRLRAALVTAQLAVAVLLLIGAGLLIRSFQRVMDVNPGFDATHILIISSQVPRAAQTPQQRSAFYQRVHDELTATPGVESVAAASRLPMLGMNLGSALFVENKSTPGEQGPDAEYRVVTNNYFSTMGIPLVAGRFFDPHDDPNAAGIVIINQTTARRYWPDQSAIGRRIKLGPSPERQPWITIVGVVGDIRHFGLDADPRPEVYRPYAQNPLGSPNLVIRTAGDPSFLASTLSAKVRSISAEVPTYNVTPMQPLVDRSTRQRRFVMWMLTVFSLAALLLAGLGVYGTIAQSVAQRTQEIGLRMALGASPAAALRLIFRQGAWLTLIGIGAGVTSAALLTRLLGKMLFEVRPLDPLTFAGASLVLAAFALLACYLPARRAVRVDPLVALRQDQ